MKRLLVVYNLKSSRFKDVEREVLVNLRNLNGYMIGKYEIQRIGVDKNVEQFAKLVEDGDLVLSVGGDATGVIAANGVLKSGKDATLAVLPYGNFNDLARTLGTKKLEDVLGGKTRKMWPLEILVDGKHYRYATCYTTIGMTAEAVELFDDSKVRKGLQKGHKSSWRERAPYVSCDEGERQLPLSEEVSPYDWQTGEFVEFDGIDDSQHFEKSTGPRYDWRRFGVCETIDG